MTNITPTRTPQGGDPSEDRVFGGFNKAQDLMREDNRQAFLRDAFNQFKEDQTCRFAVRKYGYEFLEQAALVELFVVRMNEGMEHLDVGEYDLYTTPYFKVVERGKGLSRSYRRYLKPGRIFAVKDLIMTQTLNPAHEVYEKAKDSPNFLPEESEEPLRYIRAIHSWFANGWYFCLDKGPLVFDQDFIGNMQGFMRKFNGPWTFLLPASEITARVKKSPF